MLKQIMTISQARWRDSQISVQQQNRGNSSVTSTGHGTWDMHREMFSFYYCIWWWLRKVPNYGGILNVLVSVLKTVISGNVQSWPVNRSSSTIICGMVINQSPIKLLYRQYPRPSQAQWCDYWISFKQQDQRNRSVTSTGPCAYRCLWEKGQVKKMCLQMFLKGGNWNGWTDRQREVVPKRWGTRVKGSCTCVGLDARNWRTIIVVWFQWMGWKWCCKHGVKINRLFFMQRVVNKLILNDILNLTGDVNTMALVCCQSKYQDLFTQLDLNTSRFETARKIDKDHVYLLSAVVIYFTRRFLPKITTRMCWQMIRKKTHSLQMWKWSIVG